MKRTSQSLQRRLLLLVASGALIIWTLTAIATWLDARHELDELLDSHLAQAAALLVVQQGSTDDDQRGVAPALHRYAPRVAFQVFHEGRLVQRSAGAPQAPLPGPGRSRPGFSDVTLDGEAWRVFSTQGRDRDTLIHVGERVSARTDILRAVLYGMLRSLAIALPLLLLVVWWAVRTGTLPLRAMREQLARRTPQALEPVTLPAAPRELQPLLDTLNSLFGRIAQMIDNERRFTADAAHELRTPIAAIRAQAQVALQENDAGQRRHALQATLAGCDRATRLVEQLLTLARLEGGHTPPLEALDAHAIVQRILADLTPQALRQDQSLELLSQPGMTVRTNEALLEILVRNLVDNALRYSPSGATVTIELVRQADAIRLIIADNGPGLSAAKRDRLGERFYRPVDSTAPGSGLGWSIVRRIAAVLGLTLRLDDAPQGGLLVDVKMPRAAG